MPFAAQKSSLSPPEIVLPEFALPAILPGDIPTLQALLQAQQTIHAAAVKAAFVSAVDAAVATVKREAQDTIQHMIEQLVLARHRQFGASSEQMPGQAHLFDEAEALAQSSTEAEDIAPLPPQTQQPSDQGKDSSSKKTARGKRGPLPADLPRVDVIHDVAEAERTCACGTAMVEIGEDVSEQLDIVPMQVRVLRPVALQGGSSPLQGGAVTQAQGMPCETPAPPYSQALRLPDQCSCAGHGSLAAAASPQEQCQRRFPRHVVDGEVRRWLAVDPFRQGA